jgi:hypothetical protein
MADAKKNEGPGPQKPQLQEDRIVAQLVSGAAEPSAGLTSYVGLLSRSPTAGRWRLYLSLDMSVYVEFKEEDIVHSEQLPADRSPFGSLGGTQVFVKKGAEVTTTQTVTRTLEAGSAEDEFDLDIRLGAPAGLTAPALARITGLGAGVGGSCETCPTQCDTCPSDTCVTCATCDTGCAQVTCQTCPTKCATCATCQTCATQCAQHTCVTCQTCHTCRTVCNTCPGHTCVICTHVTCFGGCGQTGVRPC